MKFGVIMHKTTQNIGDDIQTYAAKCRLPSVDYFIDREKLDKFKTEDGKPAAVVMSAWYMWKKWNWPPSEYVVPLLTGIHFSDHQASEQAGSPVKTEFLSGCGAEYMNKNGPVGCRDLYTLNKFKEIGLDAFFSGCITLTLPNRPRVEHERDYICAADLPADILAKLKEILKDKDIDIVETTHYKDYRNSSASWEEREQAVKELLTVYQNAKCVVTRRLHCALPCLAMGVPVFVTNRHKRPVSGRFDPYYDWISNCSYKEFLAGKFDYDFADPPKNSDAYLEVRNAMIASIDRFVEQYKDADGDIDDYKKTSYTAEELFQWKSRTMGECMDRWFDITVLEENELKKLRKDLAAAKAEIERKNAKLSETSTALKNTEKKLKDTEKDLKNTKASLEKKLKETEKELERHRRILNCRSVRLAVNLRNAAVGKNKKIKL